MTPGLATASSTAPPCPDGHGAMLLRQGRTGSFYSCVTYPACRRTALSKNILSRALGVPLPDDLRSELEAGTTPLDHMTPGGSIGQE